MIAEMIQFLNAQFLMMIPKPIMPNGQLHVNIPKMIQELIFYLIDYLDSSITHFHSCIWFLIILQVIPPTELWLCYFGFFISNTEVRVFSLFWEMCVSLKANKPTCIYSALGFILF